MGTISIVTSGHFSTSPRVWREADVLSRAGHDVSVIGVSYDPRQAELDQAMMRTRSWRYIAADLASETWPSRWRWTMSRLKTRWGHWRLSKGWENPDAFGYAVAALRDVALEEKADLTILHLEPALWIGKQLRQKGLAIGVDIEDWYSENRPPDLAPNEIRYLRRLEGDVLRTAVHATTTSRVMALALSKAYEVSPPMAIYNSSVSSFNAQSMLGGRPLHLLWFSQTIGPGRGLEDLFAALPQLKGAWALEIRGYATASARDWVEAHIPASIRGQVHVEPFISPDQLQSVIAQSDLGLALDPPWCRNKDLTVSNKLLQYLQSGLSVVAADTKGVQEIKTALPEAVYPYPAGHVPSLVTLLNRLIRERQAMVARRDLISRSTNEHLGYDAQAGRLLMSVDHALKGKA